MIYTFLDSSSHSLSFIYYFQQNEIPIVFFFWQFMFTMFTAETVLLNCATEIFNSNLSSFFLFLFLFLFYDSNEWPVPLESFESISMVRGFGKEAYIENSRSKCNTYDQF
jgi:hypothetical protein